MRRLFCAFSGRCFSTSASFQGGMINFAKGHPNPGLLPVEEMQEILAKVGSRSSNQHDRLQKSLNYPTSDRGDPELLAELSAFMDRHTQKDEWGSPPTTAVDDICLSESPATTDMFLTTGVSHGLEMLCRTQTKPGDVVLIEKPTYFLAADIFASHGLTMQSLPMRGASGGVDVDRLEELLQSGEMRPPRMIYIIPTHQNPTARTMSIEDRWKLAIIARRYGILVAADEVYHLLDWRDVTNDDDPRPARMALFDSMISSKQAVADAPRFGCCVSISSFTKIFAPGVRCGWIEGPKQIVDSLVSLGYIQSQGGCAPFMGELLYTSLSEGISDHVLTRLNTAYAERCRLLCQSLQTEAGIQIDTIPLGGYFLWVTFAGIDDTTAFLEYCDGRGVKFLPGKRCDTTGAEGESPTSACQKWARLCFADLDVADIEKGSRLLLSCYREYLAKLK
jgi:2-aminoadipate transaminase